MSRYESLFHRLFRRASVRTPARSLFHKPRLECLEDRLAPALILVTNLGDGGNGSLRTAIAQANTLPGDDTIAFAGGLNGNLFLSSPLQDISSDMIILDFPDPGDTGVTVRRDPTADTFAFGIFAITGGATVAITGLSISGGFAEFGGGIRNEGALTLTNCTVSGNSADFGGGIWSMGGGILTLTNCTVSGNTARKGGGISNGGSATLTNCTVSGNSALSGGGIHNEIYHLDSTLTMVNCTVSENTAEDKGGGINNHTGTAATLINCTVSGNSAFLGGGIHNFAGHSGGPFGDGNTDRMTLTNCTVSGNSAPNGGGIANYGMVVLNNTIVANSVGGDFASFHSYSGSNNLIEDGNFFLPGTISGDPNLGPLADNGGPTQTHAFSLFGSLAINAGSNALIPSGVTTDQRGPGFARIVGGTVDIGAFERQITRPASTCTVLQIGVTLHILGTREANHFAIAKSPDGGISVTCDGDDSHRFTGVQRIDLETFAGDDEVTASFANLPDNFQFRADLGAGNDRLTISGFDPQPDPPLRRVSFDIHAGAGDDEITAVCPSDPSLFEFRADLGAGNDRLSISGFDPQPDPPLRRVSFDIHAGAGDDEVMFDLGSGEINGRFTISADGGSGNDLLVARAIVPCLLPESELRITLSGDAGDDVIEASVTGLENEGRFILAANGGAGNDRLGFGAIVPCLLPESELRITLSGDAGDDVIEASVTGLENEGRLILAANGGSGNDRLTFGAIVPCLLPESELQITLSGDAGDDVIEATVAGLENEGRFILEADGGAGNDRIAVRVEMDDDSRGALDVRVLGGLGDDDLTLALYGVDVRSLVTALVDGGRGRDVAHVTRNVRVANNCEEVFFLEDPR